MKTHTLLHISANRKFGEAAGGEVEADEGEGGAKEWAACSFLLYLSRKLKSSHTERLHHAVDSSVGLWESNPRHCMDTEAHISYISFTELAPNLEFREKSFFPVRQGRHHICICNILALLCSSSLCAHPSIHTGCVFGSVHSKAARKLQLQDQAAPAWLFFLSGLSCYNLSTFNTIPIKP